MSAFTLRGLGDDGTDLLTPPPPISTLITGPSVAGNVIFSDVFGAENQQAQIAAANQGFLTPQSIGAWLTQNWPFVGLGAFAFFLLAQAGGPQRYGR